MQTIAQVVSENTTVATLTIASKGASPFPVWIPGQFLRISVLFEKGWSGEHTFTISSAPEEGVIRITVKAVGPFTTALQTIRPGTEVRARGPYGTFCKGIENSPVITMIAGGIGITPFLSVLRHLVKIDAKNRIVLFWANNRLDDIIRRGELESLMHELDLRIVHALWHEDERCLTSSINCNQFCYSGLLSPEIISKHSDIINSEVFLCGPPKMNEHSVNIVKTLGVDISKIHTELILPPKG